MGLRNWRKKGHIVTYMSKRLNINFRKRYIKSKYARNLNITYLLACEEYFRLINEIEIKLRSLPEEIQLIRPNSRSLIIKGKKYKYLTAYYYAKKKRKKNDKKAGVKNDLEYMTLLRIPYSEENKILMTNLIGHINQTIEGEL